MRSAYYAHPRPRTLSRTFDDLRLDVSKLKADGARCGKVGLCLLALMFVVGASACKGGASERPLFNPLYADQLAHEALLSDKQLPGYGWRISGDDVFNEPAVFYVAGPVCNATRSLVTLSADGLIGHSQRMLELPNPQYVRVGATVRLEILVYDRDTKPAQLVSAYRDAVHNGSLVDCLSTLINAERLLSTTGLKPSAKAPTNGAAVAFDRQFASANGTPTTRHDEVFAWQQSNVAVLLNVSTPLFPFTPALSATLSKEVLQLAQGNLLKASKLR